MPGRVRAAATSERSSVGQCSSKVVTRILSSPVGNIKVTLCDQGLHSVGLQGDISDDNFSPNESEAVQLVSGGDNSEAKSKVMIDCLHWFQVYFKDPSLMKNVPRPEICCLRKPDLGFRARVWKTLADTVPAGEVINYGGLAARLNNPGAGRAVGSAMSNNPIGIIVPCHRVVRSNGMGLYHGGTRQTMKKWLLRHEGIVKF